MKKILIYTAAGYLLLFVTTLLISFLQISKDIDTLLFVPVLVGLGFFAYQRQSNQKLKFSAIVTGLAFGLYSLIGHFLSGLSVYIIGQAIVTGFIGSILGTLGGWIKSKLTKS